MDVDVGEWAAGLDELGVRMGRRFGRVEPRRQAMAYVRGLLAGLERKNGWTLAEFAGGQRGGCDAAVVPGRCAVSSPGTMRMRMWK